LQEGLVAAVPGNGRYRHELAMSCNTRATVCVWYQGPPCPDAARAVALGKRATQLGPQTARYWATLGMAHYRVGSWNERLTALQRARELGFGEDVVGLFAAMAHWQLGSKDEARRRFEEAARRMDRSKSQDPNLRRIRAEAAQLLGIREPPGKPGEEAAP